MLNPWKVPVEEFIFSKVTSVRVQGLTLLKSKHR